MPSKTLPLVVLASVAIGAASGARAEKPAYDIEDVKACSADAMRLCKDKLPDLEAIQECMKANYEQLHPRCRERFNRAQ